MLGPYAEVRRGHSVGRVTVIWPPGAGAMGPWSLVKTFFANVSEKERRRDVGQIVEVLTRTNRDRENLMLTSPVTGPHGGSQVQLRKICDV